MEFYFDIIVIGAGPAGYAAAMRAYDFGKKVCLIEKSLVGGAGIYDGALSSKTFWEISREYCQVLRKDRGFRAESVSVEYHDVAAAVATAVAKRSEQLNRQLTELEAHDDHNSGSIVTIIGAASFLDPHRLRIDFSTKEGSREITGANIIIATGSTPRSLKDVTIDGVHILTSDHLMKQKDFPQSMVIVGAGVVGCEYATIFANFGKTRVHLIDRAPRILPFEDEDVAHFCSKNLEARGVTIHHEAQLISLVSVEDGVEYTIAHSHGGRETIAVECALISIGRNPNFQGLALENSGVEFEQNGNLKSDRTKTSVPHIYAVGDATIDIAVVSVAEIEGRYAAELACGQTPRPLSYENLSTIMFLDPEVAAVGLNEIQAQEAKIPYRTATYNYSLVSRAIAMGETEGFVKLLVTDDEAMHVLGMRALGAHASTTIEAASLLMQQKLGVRTLTELLHPHPAITEALQECARMLCGTSINKPKVFRTDLRLSRVGYESPDSTAT